MVKHCPVPIQILKCLQAKPHDQLRIHLAALNFENETFKNQIDKFYFKLAALKQKIENTKCHKSRSNHLLLLQVEFNFLDPDENGEDGVLCNSQIAKEDET